MYSEYETGKAKKYRDIDIREILFTSLERARNCDTFALRDSPNSRGSITKLVII